MSFGAHNISHKLVIYGASENLSIFQKKFRLEEVGFKSFSFLVRTHTEW